MIAKTYVARTVLKVEINGALVDVSRLFISIDAVRMTDGQMSNERAPLFIQNSQKVLAIPEPIQIFPKVHPPHYIHINAYVFV